MWTYCIVLIVLFPSFFQCFHVLRACGALMMALRQRFNQRISKWIVSRLHLLSPDLYHTLDRFSPSERNSDAFPQMPRAGGLHCLLSCSRGCLFHPKMRTGTLLGRPDLLRAGKQHHCRHLLQAVRGQHLLQHRHGHPETFRGAYHAAPLRCGILCAASVVLQVQAAHPAAQWAPNWHHITGTARGELHTGRLDASSSSRPPAHIRWVQTSADIWRNSAGWERQGTAGVQHGTGFMIRLDKPGLHYSAQIHRLRLYFLSL